MDKKIVWGQYFTSEEIAQFMTSLASKPKNSLVLIPGCGKGVFIKALLNKGYSKIVAYEIDKELFKICEENFSRVGINIKNSDYLQSSRDEKFDLIIGNPPYVHWNNIKEEIRSFLTKDNFWKNYVNGEWDLLYAFIIWSVEKLNENGELIFIVPYYWFYSTHAYTLRKYLIERGFFELLLHFGEFKLFDDCFPNNIIFKFVKSSKRDKECKVIEYKKRVGDINQIIWRIEAMLKNFPQDEFEDSDFRAFKIFQFENGNPWFLAKPSEKALLEKIERASLKVLPKAIYPSQKSGSSYVKLKDVLRVGVGMVTGFDKAFIVDSPNEFNELEKEYIYPFVKAKNCRRFFITEPHYYIFVDGLPEERIKEKLPNIYNRLKHFEQSLNKRYKDKNVKWYEWATVRNYELFRSNLNQEKIFVPCLDRSLKSRFSWTEKPFYGSGDVLVIVKDKPDIKESLKYFTAWLNSSFINQWYRLKGSKRGARTAYTQSCVEEIPLRLIKWEDEREVHIYENIVAITDEILKTKKETVYQETKINELFNLLLNP